MNNSVAASLGDDTETPYERHWRIGNNTTGGGSSAYYGTKHIWELSPNERNHYNKSRPAQQNDKIDMNQVQSKYSEGIEMGKKWTFGIGLGASVWGSGFKAGVNHVPKYAQRGVTAADMAKQSKMFGKYAKAVSRIGTTAGVLDLGLTIGEYSISDKSWGDKTKLGFNMTITGMGFIQHPAVQVTSIALGIYENNGGFNGVYDYADRQEKYHKMPLPNAFGVLWYEF